MTATLYHAAASYASAAMARTGNGLTTAPSTERAVGPAARWIATLGLIERLLPFHRRTLHVGDAVQLAGEPFVHLHVVNFGTVKSVSLTVNGAAHVAGFHLKGDWIGFDSMASGTSVCDAMAMDTSEVWSLRYSSLLQAATMAPELMHGLHAAMSCQMARDRDWRFALGHLSADARVADFVRGWAVLLAERGLRTDQITLRMTRADIGNYLGMTLESVSRAFTRLADLGLIRFEPGGRRHFGIPSVLALVAFVEHTGDGGKRASLQ